MKVDIIGAGIGGLTTGLTLQHHGINSQIFEQAEELKPVGAGIILANNAMQIFEQLNLRKEIEHVGNILNSINITTKELKTISAVDLNYFQKVYGVKSVAIHRGQLQEILISKYQGTIKLSHKLENVIHKNKHIELHYKNQQVQISNMLIAADGIHSVVRKKYFKTGEIRDAKQICWRGIAEFTIPEKYSKELNEAWGNGDRFGFVKIDTNKVYWYALKTIKPSVKYKVEKLKHYFESYHPIINDIIQSTPLGSIHTAKMTDLKPFAKWFKGPVCLIGDAAHATTPNLGQGACQSIEDAYVIADCLKNNFNIEAFEKFRDIRISKVHDIVKTSWTLGKVSHWENPIAIAIRNNIMKFTPKKISRKQSDKIFRLEV